jgi:mediator of RNA polymerase II transcription subunit 4
MTAIVENNYLGTRRKLDLLVQEMDTICREIICQMYNSSSTINHATSEISTQTLIDMFIERQTYLNQQIRVVRQQQEYERQIQLKREEILKCERALRCLQTYLLQAVQVLSSAVHQARDKLANIRRARTFPSETIIRYAHQLASAYSTMAPDNWHQGDIRRPFPTNIDMTRGLLGRISEHILQQQQSLPSTTHNLMINAAAIVDSSACRNWSLSYIPVTTAVQSPKHDMISFSSDIFSRNKDETGHLSSSDTDSDGGFF